MSVDDSVPHLLNFFIFNSKLGQKEGHEEEKLLYYYPKSDTLDVQVKHVGLSEAIIRFSGTFNQKSDCEYMHTQKKHQIFLQAEPDIWLVLTVSVGWIIKEKDGNSVREYLSEGIHDSVLKANLSGAYEAFCFHHQSILYQFVKLGLATLKDLLWKFYDEYIPVSNLSSGDLLSIWRGLSFLPSDKQNFLRVHCVLSILQSTFPTVIHTAFLYDGKFVWCGFGMKDLQPIFYHMQSLLQRKPVSETSDQCFYSNDEKKFQIVYLHNDRGDLQPYKLVIYSKLKISVCLTFPKSIELPEDTFSKITDLLNQKIVQLSMDIKCQLNNQTTNQDDDFKFIYHNHMNLATKTSLMNTIPLSTMKTIIDMHQDLLGKNCTELVFKTAENFWIVARMNNGRESYVIVNQKTANLDEISDQVTKMCASHFNNIFMIE